MGVAPAAAQCLSVFPLGSRFLRPAAFAARTAPHAAARPSTSARRTAQTKPANSRAMAVTTTLRSVA